MMRDLMFVFCGEARVKVQHICIYTICVDTFVYTVKRWLLCFTKPILELGLDFLNIYHGHVLEKNRKHIAN